MMDRETRKQRIVVATEKGGVRKSTSAAALAAHLLSTGTRIAVVQIDDQAQLARAFGDIVTTVRMPSADSLRHNDMADAEALEPALRMLLEFDGNVIFDVGANYDGRLCDALAMMDIDQDCTEQGIALTAIVPMTPDPDAVILGARTIKRVQIALPSARIVPMLCLGQTDHRALGDAAAQRIFDTVVEPLAKACSIRHPRLLPRAAAAVTRSSRPAWDLVDLSYSEIAAEVSETEIAARMIRGDLALWRYELATQFDRLFG